MNSIFNAPNAAYSDTKSPYSLHEENRARLPQSHQTKEEKDSFGHLLKRNYSSSTDEIANVNTTSNNDSSKRSENFTRTSYFVSNIFSNFFSDSDNKIENKTKSNSNTLHLDQSHHLEKNKTIHSQVNANSNSSSNKNSNKNEKKNDPQSATMFAAAAVAAAAALTAITTTSTSSTTATPANANTSSIGRVNNHAAYSTLANKHPQGYISWTQYARERRNSLQRRKVEISRRLEKASNVSKRGINEKNPTKDQSKSNQEPNSNDKTNIALNKKANLEQFKFFNDLNEHDHEWLKALTLNVCNEFIQVRNKNEPSNDTNEKADNPHFNMLSKFINIDNADNKVDMNEIGQALLEFIQSQNLPLNILNNDTPINKQNLTVNTSRLATANKNNNYNDFCNKNASKNALLTNNSVRRREHLRREYSRHRWDPKWLKSVRLYVCLPLSMLTFVFLLFTTISSSWIHFGSKY